MVIPFFSEVWLPDEKGTYLQVADFRKHRASRDSDKAPRYYCVRVVWDGDWIHQLCDPNDPSNGRTTGVVRAAVEEWWNDLKRAHWIDRATRMMTVTVPFYSNNAGVRSRVTFAFESTSTNTVLPSFDSQTRVVRTDMLAATASNCWIALGFTAFFCFLEVIEMKSAGVTAYFQDMWNVMDWLNYLIFFLVFMTMRTYLQLHDNLPCSQLCERAGYVDDWEVMTVLKQGKLYLSLCVCIQLLKIIKFVSALIPKFDLAPSVLKKALADLVFFTVVFFITMIAFSTMFYIQLGPFMAVYATQEGALVATGRALFGDFDIGKILDNSSGYMNTLLFLVYLFTAVFIMLSMFFAILGEAQANLRDEQRAKVGVDAEPEYGVITHVQTFLTEKILINTPVIGDRIREQRKAERGKKIEFARTTPPSPVERIEARQLELTETVTLIHTTVLALAEAVQELKNTRTREDARAMSFTRGMSMSGGRSSKSSPPRHRDARRSKERVERDRSRPDREAHQRSICHSSASHDKVATCSNGDRTQVERPRGNGGAKLVEQERQQHDRKPAGVGRSAKELKRELLDARLAA